MKIIVPMAGIGKRMRPHTLTVPKPLLAVAGKPIVQRLVEDIAAVCWEPIDEIAFIIGDFGKEVEQKLISVAEDLGAKGTICYQEEALGTGHAVLCAGDALSGKVIVAFADTLFRADFKLDTSQDGIIWVQQIEDPSAFGVVKVDENNTITDFLEKPKTFVSDLAIIGIYFFANGENLRSELQYLIDNDVVKGGEYQLTDALENMKQKGVRFAPGQVKEWLDCGNKDATVHTNQRVLESLKGSTLIDPTATMTNSVVIEPCFIGAGAVLRNSVVGPHVSIGAQTTVERTVVTNSIIGANSMLNNCNLDNSMVGNHTSIEEGVADLSVGDYNTISNN